MMRIYLIGRIGPVDYGQYDAMVVRARNAKAARKLAQEENPSEIHFFNGGEVAKITDLWLNSAKSKISVIGTASNQTKEDIILTSYNAG